MADVPELGVGRLAGTPRVAGGPDTTAQLVEVDDDRDAVRVGAGRRLRRSGHAEPHRRGHEDRDGEAYDEPGRHARQDRQRVRASRAGAACEPARRHWSRDVLSIPSFFASLNAAWS